MKFEKFENIKNLDVAVFGDFMVDQYITGSITRISPEAPVPILKIENKFKRLGGAGNVINNLVEMGVNVSALGYCGEDPMGDWITHKLSECKVKTEFFYKLSEVKTITKTRLLSKNQQFMRLDEETIIDAPTIFCENIRNNINNVLKDLDVLIISDYAKGSVTDELCKFLIKCANEKMIPVIVDPKGTNYSKYKNTTLCTPNTKELLTAYGEDDQSEKNIISLGKKMCLELNLTNLVLTRSEKGITIFNKVGKSENFPVVKKDVIDVTGAGDTVVAMLAISYALGFAIEDCCKLANAAASIVCSKAGAATLTISELLGSFNNGGEFKFIDLDSAAYITKINKNEGKKVVFTNGCFDLFHAGHLASLVKAKEFGDILVVGVNSDTSVKRLKGNLRPIIAEKNRIAILSALECVDYIVLIEDDTPLSIIEKLQPSVSIKGRDWENKYIPEREVIESYGGKMVFIDLEEGLSTTSIISKIVSQNEKH